MHRIIALLTTGCFTFMTQLTLSAPAAAAPPSAATEVVADGTRVIESDSLIDAQGRQIDYELWLEDGIIYGDARVVATDGSYLELWRHGDIIHYEGAVDGEPVTGELPIDADLDAAPACLGWFALVCVGALFLNSGGCAIFEGCVPTPKPEPPGGQGGVPEGEEPNEDSPAGGGDGE
jgi:hypothetical protein